MTHLHAALTVACPTCGARPYERCRAWLLRAEPPDREPHHARRQALEDRNRQTGTIR